jgi:V/A-type H+/Na+-transporting ATPase subunit B
MQARAGDPPLFTLEHLTVSNVSGPLLVAERVQGVGLHEMVDVVAPGGGLRRGQILEVDGSCIVVQVLAGAGSTAARPGSGRAARWPRSASAAT